MPPAAAPEPAFSFRRPSQQQVSLPPNEQLRLCQTTCSPLPTAYGLGSPVSRPSVLRRPTIRERRLSAEPIQLLSAIQRFKQPSHAFTPSIKRATYQHLRREQRKRRKSYTTDNAAYTCPLPPFNSSNPVTQPACYSASPSKHTKHAREKEDTTEADWKEQVMGRWRELNGRSSSSGKGVITEESSEERYIGRTWKKIVTQHSRSGIINGRKS
jgi:hypothetical protein